MAYNFNIEEIKEQFVKVLEYSQNISNLNVDELFAEWQRKKFRFIDFFDGNLIYEYPEKVSFDIPEADKKNKLSYFINKIFITWGYSELVTFLSSQGENSFFNNLTVSDFTTKNGKIIKKGTKLIKSFKYFVNDERSLTDLQNEASRIIQENKIEGKLCLSVHPLDFLSLSENTHNWRSCHSLDGEYRAGNLSYMLDDATFICYLCSEEPAVLPNFPPQVQWNSKKWRVLFYLSPDGNYLFSGKQYPFDLNLELIKDNMFNGTIYTGFGGCEWSKWYKAINEISDINNEKTVSIHGQPYVCINSELKRVDSVVINEEGSRHFNDVLSSSCYIPLYSFKTVRSLFQESNDRDIPKTSSGISKLKIGGCTKCIKCGQEEVMGPGSNTMLCFNCELNYGSSNSEDFAYCNCCNARFFAEDGHWVGDDFICEYCYDNECSTCECCEEAYFNDDIRYDEKTERYLCVDCYQAALEEREELMEEMEVPF